MQADIATGAPGPVMVKTHNALIDYLGAPLINRAVSAGAVYVVRNPLDIAISLAHFRGVAIDAAIDEMATAGAATETNDEDVYFVTGSWSEHVASWTAPPNAAILPVRYEDMLADPAGTFTAIATHVQMPASPEQIAHAIALTTFQQMQQAESRKGFLEKPPHVERFFREGRAGQLAADAERRTGRADRRHARRADGTLRLLAGLGRGGAIIHYCPQLTVSCVVPPLASAHPHPRIISWLKVRLHVSRLLHQSRSCSRSQTACRS